MLVEVVSLGPRELVVLGGHRRYKAWTADRVGHGEGRCHTRQGSKILSNIVKVGDKVEQEIRNHCALVGKERLTCYCQNYAHMSNHILKFYSLSLHSADLDDVREYL